MTQVDEKHPATVKRSRGARWLVQLVSASGLDQSGLLPLSLAV